MTLRRVVMSLLPSFFETLAEVNLWLRLVNLPPPPNGSPLRTTDPKTWQWKFHHLKMFSLWKMEIFQYHVSFQGCKGLMRPYSGKPMVNKPSVSRGGALGGGGRLTSRNHKFTSARVSKKLGSKDITTFLKVMYKIWPPQKETKICWIRTKDGEMMF